ncbi:hypothetical protein P691DRAFT_768670 [Macrolepiota fuliginosa MF-IS2]|uniref:Uncharacterized protein n=1 Tax=Macrolepiota fuliginosa MF-IS2 TaxID=1400762 RepID=A0A9P5WX30_9AGAR|nr:hypothetical protein P691DRAFT_768670 [Macrolepiota fuliginosa MF-IS2]
MQRIPPNILLTVLLFMCALAPEFGTNRQSVLFMSNLLGLSELAFKTVCSQLSAVVHFQDQDGLPPTHTADTSRPFQHANREVVNQLWDFITTHLGGSISFYHKSFYDFLVDPSRSGPFHVLSSGMRNAMFKRCVELHLKYQESYCFQGSGERNLCVRLPDVFLSVLNTELVLAPDVPDSAFSLSYPYINELINSSLKAYMIVSAHRMCLALFTFSNVDLRLLQQFQHADFRKHLYIDSTLHPPGEISSMRVWRYRGLIKFISGTRLFQHLSHDVRLFLPEFEGVSQFYVVIRDLVIKPFKDDQATTTGRDHTDL